MESNKNLYKLEQIEEREGEWLFNMALSQVFTQGVDSYLNLSQEDIQREIDKNKKTLGEDFIITLLNLCKELASFSFYSDIIPYLRGERYKENEKIKDKIKILKSLDCLMRLSEDAYYEWISYGVPIEPSRNDFKNIAKNDEDYQDCLDVAKRIVKKYIK